ncbi:MAG TPA: ABC transporter permease [Sphingobium sp.]
MNSQVHAPFVLGNSLAQPMARPLPSIPLRAMLRSLSGLRAGVAIPLALLGLMLLCALVPSLIAPYGPMDMDGNALLQAPSGTHILGTDHLGRDVFSLVVHGARQSIMVAASAVVVGLSLGGLIGLITGYVGGWVDGLFMRVLEVWLAIPDILLVIALATALRPSLTNMILTIGIVSVPRYARVMRAQVMAIKHRPFVEASRAIGASDFSILRGHILPHSLSPMLVLATLGIANAAQMGAALSFIGLGVVDDIPDWGFLLSQAQSYLTVAWWFGAFPGLAITTLAIGVNVLGNSLRQKLDPRAKTR